MYKARLNFSFDYMINSLLRWKLKISDKEKEGFHLERLTSLIDGPRAILNSKYLTFIQSTNYVWLVTRDRAIGETPSCFRGWWGTWWERQWLHILGGREVYVSHDTTKCQEINEKIFYSVLLHSRDKRSWNGCWSKLLDLWVLVQMLFYMFYGWIRRASDGLLLVNRLIGSPK